jgi:hypothetical protein
MEAANQRLVRTRSRALHSRDVENITEKSTPKNDVLVTAKRGKIEHGKSYRYWLAKECIHQLNRAGDFIRRTTSTRNLEGEKGHPCNNTIIVCPTTCYDRIIQEVLA